MANQGERKEAQTRLFKAIEEGDLDGVRELLELDPGLALAHNSEGGSALIWAAYYRKPAISDLLVSSGAQPNIFEASALNLNDRIKDLLRSDSTLVETYSYDGWTPLHLAAHFGSLDALRTLVENGGSHRAVSRNNNGNQPLQAAAAGGQAEAVAVLLEAGADANARSEGGFTALHSAAANGDAGVAKLLLEAGATASTKTEDGRTPIELAIEADHADIVDMLEAAVAA